MSRSVLHPERDPLLAIEDVSIRFATPDGAVEAVSNLSLSIEPGECLGVVGESGAGKSQSFLAVLSLLADNAKISGSIRFCGEELIGASRARLNRLRGNEISIVFQDSITGLTPHMPVGKQLVEVLQTHRRIDADAARREVIEIMEVMHIAEPEKRFRMYPHEFSGGMRQRIMIALAMLCKPRLLIADEPTTALDVTVQAAILRLFAKLKAHTDTALVIITHDLGVVAGLADRVAVMYGGRLVEMAPVDELFASPQHPYTQGLLRSMPRLDAGISDHLPAIPGQPPNLQALPPGCAFAPRCDRAEARCTETRPLLRPSAPARMAACHLVAEPA